MLLTMRRPRLSVRSRLTGLYGLMFVLSGALLLAIAGGVTISRTATAVVAVGHHAPPTGSALRRIRQLQLQIAADSQSQSAVSHHLITASFIALAIMTVLSVGLGWLVAGGALRPVRQMTEPARRISEDSLNERLSVSGPRDELKVLGDTIDGLLERLEA